MIRELHHFIIFKFCPQEQIFDGKLTFTEARQFMDKNASDVRRVSFKVFNDLLDKWQFFRDVSYHGNREVFVNGVLYTLDSDYKNLILV